MPDYYDHTPTGREMLLHRIAWNNLTAATRPAQPFFRWNAYRQGWEFAPVNLPIPDLDTLQHGYRLVKLLPVADDVSSETETETEMLSVWDAVMSGRLATTPDGKFMDLGREDVILVFTGKEGVLMYDDASHPEENRPRVTVEGLVEVVVEDEDLAAEAETETEAVPVTSMLQQILFEDAELAKEDEEGPRADDDNWRQPASFEERDLAIAIEMDVLVFRQKMDGGYWDCYNESFRPGPEDLSKWRVPRNLPPVPTDQDVDEYRYAVGLPRGVSPEQKFTTRVGLMKAWRRGYDIRARRLDEAEPEENEAS